MDAEGGVVQGANPWAVRFEADLQAFAAVSEEMTSLWEIYSEHCTWFVYRRELADECQAIGAAVIRAIVLLKGVPPPGITRPLDGTEEEQEEAERPFQCEQPVKRGELVFRPVVHVLRAGRV